jgi:L-aminopeptidase/D-esterase-like protein
LATADGVTAWLAERGRGFPTRGGPVPIVPAAAIYDLVSPQGEGSAAQPPGAVQGRLAADAAERAAVGVGQERGRVGAGTGATIGKWRGGEHAVPGGLGVARGSTGAATLEAIAVVNAVGDVIDADGSILAGSTAPPEVGAFPDPAVNMFENTPHMFENTTLVVLATDARLTKLHCRLLAESGHHGLALAIRPSHTRHDGDLVIGLATGTADLSEGQDMHGQDITGPGIDRLRVIATDVVAEAVRNAVRQT